jgi:hypothetical protein
MYIKIFNLVNRDIYPIVFSKFVYKNNFFIQAKNNRNRNIN